MSPLSCLGQRFLERAGFEILDDRYCRVSLNYNSCESDIRRREERSGGVFGTFRLRKDCMSDKLSYFLQGLECCNTAAFSFVQVTRSPGKSASIFSIAILPAVQTLSVHVRRMAGRSLHLHTWILNGLLKRVCFRLPEFLFPDRNQAYRPRKTGFLQRIVLFPMSIGCKSTPSRRTLFPAQKPVRKFQEHEFHTSSIFRVRGQLFIADQAVDPAVGHVDRKLIFPCNEEIRHIAAERRLPENSEIPAVEPDRRSIANLPEIQNPPPF